ncbi:MAG: 50S ribosomal protein L1 [Verrucomicrobia bacterium]|nr:50S ribosomal protein L1 [Verrucomicrobiota bacterium]
MARRSKRFKVIDQLVVVDKKYTLDEAIEILKKCPPVKFDQSVDLAIKSGIDVKKSDQQVRGTIALPHGTGKNLRVLVFARGDKIKEAEAAGAEFAGADELLEKVKGGWTDFDAIVSTPDMMREVGKLGKVLGPRGLMPTPKAGTVTNEIGKAVKELKAGKIEFKNDKTGNINNLVGKLSFSKKDLIENIEAYLSAVAKAKPSSAKGNFIQSLSISSTMGPGLKVDLSSVAGM